MVEVGEGKFCLPCLAESRRLDAGVEWLTTTVGRYMWPCRAFMLDILSWGGEVDFLLGSEGERGGGVMRGEKEKVWAHDLDRRTEDTPYRTETSAPRREQARSPRQSQSNFLGSSSSL